MSDDELLKHAEEVGIVGKKAVPAPTLLEFLELKERVKILEARMRPDPKFQRTALEARTALLRRAVDALSGISLEEIMPGFRRLTVSGMHLGQIVCLKVDIDIELETEDGT